MAISKKDVVSMAAEHSSQQSKEQTGGSASGTGEYLLASEALEQQMQLLKRLPERQRWPFGYGPLVLSINAGLVGVIGNSFFRRMLMVRKGLFLTSIPSVLMPALLIAPAYIRFVTQPVLLNNLNCTVCAEIRGGLINVVLGALYPIFLAAPLNAALAKRYETVKVPSMSYKEFNRSHFVSFWRSKIRYFKGQFVTIAIFQTVCGMFVARSQMRVVKQELSGKLVKVDR